jgi:hypothetical protein
MLQVQHRLASTVFRGEELETRQAHSTPLPYIDEFHAHREKVRRPSACPAGMGRAPMRLPNRCGRAMGNRSLSIHENSAPVQRGLFMRLVDPSITRQSSLIAATLSFAVRPRFRHGRRDLRGLFTPASFFDTSAIGEGFSFMRLVGAAARAPMCAATISEGRPHDTPSAGHRHRDAAPHRIPGASTP